MFCQDVLGLQENLGILVLCSGLHVAPSQNTVQYIGDSNTPWQLINYAPLLLLRMAQQLTSEYINYHLAPRGLYSN